MTQKPECDCRKASEERLLETLASTKPNTVFSRETDLHVIFLIYHLKRIKLTDQWPIWIYLTIIPIQKMAFSILLPHFVGIQFLQNNRDNLF